MPVLSIHDARHAQLDQLRHALGGVSFAEALGYLINKEIERGGHIPPGVPGVTTTKVEAGVAIAFDDNPAVHISNEELVALVTNLEVFSDKTAEAQTVINIGGNYMLERRGQGIVLQMPIGGTKKSFTADLARDLAAHLKSAKE